eukprot:CAMPEP_0170443712 /NCGR_PEP_ID=MMETSP0117_2-20130122/48127_1 /TAXON_ID=400756 /ORGANISM="Durinskia baltica, Strain CSIRO CS-38" /LENGTH=68 /DNA_ID=CAMNT_0010704445 /DNA_START=155 /DNA_END=357 /DNA_ORIENTATION=-
MHVSMQWVRGHLSVCTSSHIAPQKAAVLVLAVKTGAATIAMTFCAHGADSDISKTTLEIVGRAAKDSR